MDMPPETLGFRHSDGLKVFLGWVWCLVGNMWEIIGFFFGFSRATFILVAL